MNETTIIKNTTQKEYGQTSTLFLSSIISSLTTSIDVSSILSEMSWSLLVGSASWCVTVSSWIPASSIIDFFSTSSASCSDGFSSAVGSTFSWNLALSLTSADLISSSIESFSILISWLFSLTSDNLTADSFSSSIWGDGVSLFSSFSSIVLFPSTSLTFSSWSFSFFDSSLSSFSWSSSIFSTLSLLFSSTPSLFFSPSPSRFTTSSYIFLKSILTSWIWILCTNF